MLPALLAGGLIRKGHDGGAEALLVDTVHGRIDGCEAVDLPGQGVRQLVQPVSEMGHIAHADGSIALLGMGDGDHRGVLVEVVVAAVPVSFPIRLGGLETGAGEGSELSVLVGHLGTLYLDGNPFPDAPDYIFQQFGIAVDIPRNHIVQVICGAVFHLVEILVPSDGFDSADAADFTAPDAGDGNDDCDCEDADPFQKLLHNYLH